MTPSGVHVNKPLIAIVAGVLVLATVGYKYSGHILGTARESGLETKSGLETEFKMEEKPKKDMTDNAKLVDGVKEGDLKINVDSTPVTVHYRLAEPNVCKLDILFLHGAAFSSKTWFEKPMQSLQVLSKLGYKVLAIDLPGYGQSPGADADPSRYLEEVIKGFQLNKPVIISPSMSGGFSLPYLFKDPANVLTRARGYVPVAPGGTEKYSKQYGALKIPTLIICGDKDKGLGKTSVENLKQIPGSELKMYENSGHPAYLDRPEDFHKDLDHFFTKILETKT